MTNVIDASTKFNKQEPEDLISKEKFIQSVLDDIDVKEINDLNLFITYKDGTSVLYNTGDLAVKAVMLQLLQHEITSELDMLRLTVDA